MSVFQNGANPALLMRLGIKIMFEHINREGPDLEVRCWDKKTSHELELEVFEVENKLNVLQV
jgi:hypothetical protein